MRDAQRILEMLSRRGQRRSELRRVYRLLYNQELYLRAYAKLYANDGALTAGSEGQDTVDGMTLKRIEKIINALKAGTYRWRAARRSYIGKKNGQKRPLSMPGWEDKLLQEVLRMILSAYYEPQFHPSSHGFRAGRGCHTALQTIKHTWQGSKWFIEGDIKGCFDHIDHERLLAIIGRQMKDERLHKLLRGMLQAGYLEEWRYERTYSGTPQGNVLSPLLANILLNELDWYINEELIPAYNHGRRRRRNPRYERLTRQMTKAKRTGDRKRYRQWRQQRNRLPTGDPQDPHYRRLKYIRYADDFLLGFIGPKEEARAIKSQLSQYLRLLGLTLSEEKTLITHAQDGRARFLGYDLRIAHEDSCHCNGRRTMNGQPVLSVPREVAQQWCTRQIRKGKPIQRGELLRLSDYEIVMTYAQEFNGLSNYYRLAGDIAKKLSPVKWVYHRSLVKSLAAKHKRSARWVYRRYYGRQANGRKGFKVEVAREGKAPLIAHFGDRPLRYDPQATIEDNREIRWQKRNEVVQRLLAEKCELCGARQEVEMHHIRKLKELERRYAGRRPAPEWVQRMIEIRRKTLAVCHACHQRIHQGTYDGRRLRYD